MPTLEEIRSGLAAHTPERKPTTGSRRAAVAMVLREGREGPEVLFIERARHPADPWSGHMAFPGGRVDPGDAGTRSAAERETLEEVGVSLEEARYLGRLVDLEGRHAGRPGGMLITAHVYEIRETPRLDTNYEVEAAFWFPVPKLLERERHVGYQSRQTAGLRFPGVLVGEPDRHIVWGLTYRFLEVFFEVLGRDLSAD